MPWPKATWVERIYFNLQLLSIMKKHDKNSWHELKQRPWRNASLLTCSTWLVLPALLYNTGPNIHGCYNPQWVWLSHSNHNQESDPKDLLAGTSNGGIFSQLRFPLIRWPYLVASWQKNSWQWKIWYLVWGCGPISHYQCCWFPSRNLW